MGRLNWEEIVPSVHYDYHKGFETLYAPFLVTARYKRRTFDWRVEGPTGCYLTIYTRDEVRPWMTNPALFGLE